ncbi:hypothetical protein BGZ46_007879 [Entomortierella lignicola]|nr:hypothetical protein BGZ46_007879 [Entomortierella lignicola]
MSFKPPDPNVFYPIPQGQLPPGFITPPPGTAVRGIPIVVPHGLEMLISPEGFPVFVPDRAQAAAAAAASPPPSSPAYVSSPPAASHQSPMPSTPTRHNTAASLHSINQYPTPPTRHSTMPSQHQFPTPPPPVPSLPAPYASGTLPHQMPVPTHPSFASPAHMPLAHAPPSHAPPGYPVQSFAHPSHAPPAHAPPAPAPAAPAPAPAAPVGLTFASIVTSFRTSSESVSAWTFYSLGLVHNPGQKEIVITLRQRPGSYTLESVQPTMYHLYHKMNATIQQSGGKPLAAGDIFPCRLDTPDMGPLDVAILLIHAPPECKGTLENKDVLYGLIATLDEMAVFSKYGAARTLTNMGNDLETWPVPLWSDWSRPTMLHLRDFEGSLTESVMVLPTKNIVATLDTITHRLTLVVSTAALELIQVELTKYPPAQPGSVSDLSRVTFLLDLDAGAQAYLTWKAGQEGPAIFNARPNASSFHGCWLTFVGISPHDEGKVGECILPREDGIEIKMKGVTWERLYQALMSRAPAVIPVGEETVQLSYA